MQVIYNQNNQHLLRFDTGEEVLGLLQDYCQKENIEAGVLWGVGAVDEITISWYNLEEKKYHDHELKKRLEVSALHGNISLKEGKPIVHAHGSFSDFELHSRSGHAKKMIVSATVEIFIQQLEGKIERKPDEKTGLHLLS